MRRPHPPADINFFGLAVTMHYIIPFKPTGGESGRDEEASSFPGQRGSRGKDQEQSKTSNYDKNSYSFCMRFIKFQKNRFILNSILGDLDWVIFGQEGKEQVYNCVVSAEFRGRKF
jgi:hypothetical protein